MKGIILRISVAVLVLTMALSIGLTGCGGGEETTTTTTAAPPAVTTTTAAPPPATTTSAPPTTTAAPAPTGKPAAFTISGLSIQPAEIDLDGEVTISVVITNTGDLKGSYDLNITVNDMHLASKLVTLDGGKKETVTYKAFGKKAGDNTVKANELTGTFSVTAPPPPPPPPEPEVGETVYISVSVNGELLLAAQPVKIADMTIEAALIAAHGKYYSGGLGGYTAGIDPTFGMYLITQCWGAQGTPVIIINGHPNSEKAPEPVNTTPVAANDNIIISIPSSVSAVSLTATLDGGSATVTATSWTFSMATFTYSSAPVKNANVIDPVTGASLGTTDDNGQITVTVPESGIVAIEGLAAINVNASAQ